ncbi:hypothetical protein GPALN_004516 [Globodera pallida]|nr:hypothetical protein GPALN_004516 [Globodera pallida]
MVELENDALEQGQTNHASAIGWTQVAELSAARRNSDPRANSGGALDEIGAPQWWLDPPERQGDGSPGEERRTPENQAWAQPRSAEEEVQRVVQGMDRDEEKRSCKNKPCPRKDEQNDLEELMFDVNTGNQTSAPVGNATERAVTAGLDRLTGGLRTQFAQTAQMRGGSLAYLGNR